MLKFRYSSRHLVATLQNSAIRTPHQPAYLFLADGEQETARITYSELDKKARAIAAYLQSQNLAEQRVLLLYPTGLDFIAAFMGCLYAGVVAVPVNYPSPIESEKSWSLINAIAQDANITAILTTQALLAKSKEYFNGEWTTNKLLIVDTVSLDNSFATQYQTPEIKDGTIAYLQYTSGSTATPRGVIIRHGNLIHSLKHTIKAWRYTRNSITLNWAPHTHVYGLICGLLVPLCHGSLAILMPPTAFIQRPVRWLAAITHYRVTHSGCPNFGYDLCINEISAAEITKLDLKTWKVAVNGGENVKHKTLLNFSKKFKQCGFKLKHFCSAYGMSELSGAIATVQHNKTSKYLRLKTENLRSNAIKISSKKKPHRTVVSSGRIMAKLKAIIVDPDSLLPVRKGEIGEIWLQGKSLASGYWERTEETKEIFQATFYGSNKKYFRTGDLGFIKKKEIYITGRLKELIIIHGKKYYSIDIEATLTAALKEFPVAACNVAFSVPNSGNEELVIVQELKEELIESSQYEIIKTIRHAIAAHHNIDVYAVMLVKENSIPKTVSGKIQRKLCQQQFLDNKLPLIKGDIKNIIPVQSAEGEFIKIVSSILQINESKINFNDSVSEYGLDSIKIIKLTNLLNDVYHLQLTPANLFEYPTLGKFYDDIKEKIQIQAQNIVNASSVASVPIITEKSENNTAKDIAIIGMSGLFPGAVDLETFWHNLIQGKDAVSEIPKERWEWEAYYGDALSAPNKTKIKWGGFIEGIAQFDAKFFNIAPREAELMDPQQRLFLQVAWHAIENAGYSTADLAKISTGLFVGVFNNDYAELLQTNGITDAYITTGVTNSILANRVSYLLNLTGPSIVIDTTCSSSLVALHQAVQAIQQGDCEAAIVGGANALLTPTAYLAASKAGMLSEDGRCKTFDKDANGYVRGEGIAAILLKPLDKAQSDGDHIYGVIKGTAVNHGGLVNSLTAPNPNAQADVIVAACRRAQIPFNTISYIETHGTGTPLGDPIEINGLKKAFDILNNEQTDKTPSYHYCGLGAIKTHIGHLESAAGIAGVIKVLLAMQHGEIPGNLHLRELNPYIKLDDSPFYIVDKTQPWLRLKDKDNSEIPRRAGVSSFGFGGTNAHILLEEFISPKKNDIPKPAKTHYLILLSAKTEIALQQRIQDLNDWLVKQVNTPSLAAISYTLNIGRNHFEKRSVLVVKSILELQEGLIQLLQGKKSEYSIGIDEYQNSLFALAESYMAGNKVDCNGLYEDERIARLPLPVYPFAKTSYWVSSKPITKELGFNLNYYSPLWAASEFINKPPAEYFSKKDVLLVFSNNSDILPTLTDYLPAVSIVLVKQGSTFSAVGPNIYTVNPGEKADYINLCDVLVKNYGIPTHVLHLWAESSFENTLATIDIQLDISLVSLLYLTEALLLHKPKQKIMLLYAYFLHAAEMQSIYASVSAFAKTLALEYFQFDCRIIEVALTEKTPFSVNVSLKKLLAEFQATEISGLQIRYEDERRFVRSITKIENNRKPISSIKLKPCGIYLITGGLGNLGFIFAEYLAQSLQAKLILVGRSKLDAEKTKKIQQLEALGSEVLYLSSDITDKKSAENLIQEVKQRYGLINGIIHAAGVVQDQRNFVKESTSFRSVLAPKILGTILLDETTKDESLDFFVLFSSIAAVLGGSAGQSDYACANAFMDSYAHERESLTVRGLRSGKTIAINWPLWSTVGMGVDPASISSLTSWLQQTMGLSVLEKQQGLAAFLEILQMDATQVVVAGGDSRKILSALEHAYKLVKPDAIMSMHTSTVQPQTSRVSSTISNNDFSAVSLLPQVQQELVLIIAALLKLNPSDIDHTVSFSELGFDSIALKEFAARLANRYDIELTPAIFFAHNTIQALSEYFLATFAAKIRQIYKQDLAVPNNAVFPAAQTSDTLYSACLAEYEPIAIIGMQGFFPQSENLAEFWRHLAAGDDLITEIPQARWDSSQYFGDAQQDSSKTNSKWGGLLNEVTAFDAAFFNLSAREVNLMDPQHRLFLEVVWKTIEDAGYDPLSLSGQEVGVFVGAEFSDYQALLAKQQKIFHGYRATGNAHAMLPNRVSYFLNLRGPSESIDTACSSALVAINRAVHALRSGECSSAIAGGVSLMLDPETLVMTSQLGVLSPDGRCKTFDKTANGYVKGEGVAAIFLKPLAKAQADGDHIYGVIKGSAVNHGGKAQSLTAPNTHAQSQLLIKTYTQANVEPDTITYIETHGTGTELGDPVEIEGLKQAFHTLLTQKNKLITPSQAYCGLGAIKTNIGHLEPAAGIAGVIKVLLAMQYGKIPGNLHCNELNPYINLIDSPFYIVNKTQEWQRLKDAMGALVPRRAGVSSFGFGGSNAHVLIEEAFVKPLATNKSNQNKPYYLLTLSAKQEQSLKQKIVDLQEWLRLHLAEIQLENLSFTLNVGRSHFNARCAIVVNSLEELQETLELLVQDKISDNCLINVDQKFNLQGPLFAEVYRSTMGFVENYSTIPAQNYREHLLMLADLYTKNYAIEWHRLHAGESKQRIAGLPHYPFIKQHYWFDAELPEYSQQKEKILPTKPMSIGSDINSSVSLPDFTITYLQRIFSEKTSFPLSKIAIDATYEAYGIDSILGLEITKRLEQDFGTLPKTLLYEKNRLQDLAVYFQKYHKDTLHLLANNTIGMKEEVNVGWVELAKPNEPDLRASLKTNYEDEDIAIIGLSGTYPLAKDIQEFWQNLQQGRDCITEVPSERWDYKDYPVIVAGEKKYYKHGGFIADFDKFDPLFFNIAPSDAALMDPQERLFLQSAWTTLEDAGYTRASLQNTVNNEVGVFVGVTHNFYPIFIAEEWAKDNRLPLMTQTFSIANRVSYLLNLNGPSYVVDTACSSSLAAIHAAYESVVRGECKMAIAGGVNLSLHPTKYHMLGYYSFMSEQGRCSSFAAGGNGYVPAEGVGSVLLKSLSLAIKEGDRIYGVIKSSSMNHGGKTSGYTVPNPNAQTALIKNALEKANIDPRTITYIEAHGTGTSLGDPIEIRGLQEAFAEYTQDKQFCAIGSVKSNIGHLEAAAGISQLTKVLLQLQHKKLVPSLHANELNPYIDFAQTPFFVQKKLSDWAPIDGQPRRAGISSFGAGGTNIHLIVEEFIPDSSAAHHTIPSKTKIPFVFLLSALNTERLQEYVRQVYEFLITEGEKQRPNNSLEQWLFNVCYTSQIGRESMVEKLAIAALSYQELLEKLKMYLEYHTIPVTTNIPAQYQQLVSAWIKGDQVAWEQLYSEQKPHKVFIPTYPFAKRPCWIPTKEEKKTVEETTELLNDWLYCTSWQHKPAKNEPNVKANNEHWLIFSDKELGFLLQDELGKSACTYCFVGEEFAQLSPNIFYINPTNIADYNNLLTQITPVTGIIYLWALEDDIKNSNQADLATDSLKMQAGEKLLMLFQALIQQQHGNKLHFSLITRGTQPIRAQDPVNLWQHHLGSLVRIFAAEQADYQVLLLDLDIQKSLRKEAQAIAHEIQHFQPTENQVAYRESRRYIPLLSSYLNSDVSFNEEINCKVPETVLITGGLGGLGSELAKWLAQQGTKYMLLIGNTVLPNRSEWPTLQHAATQEKIAVITYLETMGVAVEYRAVDVCDKISMQSTITTVEHAWNKAIQGVFHLAGITTDSIPIAEMSAELLQKVLAVKMQGALVLHDVFNQHVLNYFVLFSSTSALPYFGIRGLSAYAMANEFLNGLAVYRRRQGLPALSINWATWAEKGMGVKYNHTAFLEAVGMSAVPLVQGMDILKFLLIKQPENIAVFKVQWQKFLQINVEAKKLAYFANFSNKEVSVEPSKKIDAPLNNEQVLQLLNKQLAGLLALEMTEIDPVVPLQNYGVDSIVGIKFVAVLNEYFPDVVSPMDLYRYTTVKQLADFIFQSSQLVNEEAQPQSDILQNGAVKENCRGERLLALPTDNDALLAELTQLSEAEVEKLLEDELLE